MPSKILMTAGEPAGIGPDLCLSVAAMKWPARLIAIADPELLRERAAQLALDIDIVVEDAQAQNTGHGPGVLPCIPMPLAVRAKPGVLEPRNAEQVVNSIRVASQACLDRTYDGMVTAPVHKAVINDAGIPFSGHTELVAEVAGVNDVVMMLLADDLRVALVTTHLALRDVADAITAERIECCVRVVHDDLVARFGIAKPRILVCGLNPHAGEGGHLGTEELDTVIPALDRMRAQGLRIDGPVPADTAFTAQRLQHADVVIAMFHDQGLPVLKHFAFGEAVNMTLGLPIIRTSVDHGTALDLAGSGKADAGSMCAALRLAIDLAENQNARSPGAHGNKSLIRRA